MNYLDKDLLTIHNALIKKEISPDDLLKEAYNKISKVNSKINAFNLVNDNLTNLTVTDNILSGIPYAMKDNISTKGIRTTACSNSLKDYIPVYNATVYDKLLASGALMIGKTNMDELAMGGTGTTGNSGIVHNPWDLNKMTGGSSAGSAAAVAAGIVPYAIGTDTGDSVRKPAAYCGVVGYKPSYGLISRYGVFAFASSLDHVGVITRNVKDAAIVVDTLKGSDTKDMTSIRDMNDESLYSKIDGIAKGKKLFYIKEICDVNSYDDQNTKNLINNFLENMEKIKSLGIEVEPISVNMNLLKAIKPIYDCISCAEATSNYANLTGILFGPRGEGDNVTDIIKDYRTKGFSSLIKRRFVIGSFALEKENQEKYFMNAKRARRIIVEKFNNLFKKYDGLILPSTSGPAPEIAKVSDQIKKDDNVLNNHLDIGNFGGYPSISIPCGFLDNMPLGICLTGAFKDDSNILNIAFAIEGKLNYSNQVKEVD